MEEGLRGSLIEIPGSPVVLFLLFELKHVASGWLVVPFVSVSKLYS